jgi:ketosteroid isomerase-like protein
MRTIRLLLAGTLSLALIGGLNVAVTAQDDEPAPADVVAVTEANEAANYAAMLAKDPDAIMATFTEDPIFEDRTFGDYLEGATAVRTMELAAASMTDAEASETLDHFVSADGSRAVRVFRWVGTNFRGAPFDLPLVSIHEYRDGKIAKESMYYAAPDPHGQLTSPPSAE